MAFIDKKDPVVLNIKLTSKGREQLSRGLLDFKYFAIGDSEMDYQFNSEVEAVDDEYTPFYSQILRPADKNPSLLSFIKKSTTDSEYNEISSIPVTVTPVVNTVQTLGFFNISGNSFSFITDTDHIKQPDVMVLISNVTGGTTLALRKSPQYLANVNEPEPGDYLLIKWTTTYGGDTSGIWTSQYDPKPFLMYKIVDVSGKLSTNNLTAIVDRELPNFSGMTSGATGITAGALVFYNYVNFSGNTAFNQYSTDFVNESVLAFLENCQCPTVTFPFWNLSIIFTDEIAGVQSGDTKYVNFDSRIYGGFVSYIQGQSPVYKKLGVIHYTNSSPSNTYAEEFGMNDPAKLPQIYLPTIMWHKKSEATLGLKLSATGSVKSLSGLTTSYYDLADEDGNIVGKVFNNLKIFVIEDQELLFAMSYKSNRSWTLPDYTVGVNDSVIVGCAPCTITFNVQTVSPTVIGGSNGWLMIYDIDGNIPGSQLILSVTGATGMIYFEPIANPNISIKITGLTEGTYYVTVYDLGALGCPTTIVTLSDPTSILSLYDVTGTSNIMNSNFTIAPTSGNQYRITISGYGDPYGLTPYFIAKPYGTYPVGTYPLLSDPAWQTSNIITLPSTPKAKYTIYIRDKGTSTPYLYVQKDYIAIPTPLLNTTITTSYTSGYMGTYISVSNYMTMPMYALLTGYAAVEISVYKSNSVPLNWVSANGMSTTYIPVTEDGVYKISMRVRKDNIIIEQRNYSNTVTIS
ncbi:MAG: hypothetical protein WC333_00640 [Dehalococcoidia bacterium]|jgi:hypothetical protein